MRKRCKWEAVRDGEGAAATPLGADCDGEGAIATPVEIAVPDELDLMGAQLPSEYEGLWIAKVVKSFGKSRDMGDTEMVDLFQEACAAATVAIVDAEAKGGSTEAFVKVAVKRRLTDLIRRFDAVAPWEVHAEDGPREEDADPDERLVENLPDPKYRPSRQKRIDAVRLAALLVSPQSQRYWKAFRETNGTNEAVAELLGVSANTVRCRIAPCARAEFKRAIALVEIIRKGGATHDNR